MNITLTPELETALTKAASDRGVSPQVLILETLQDCFLHPDKAPPPIDDWEASLLALGQPCQVTVDHDAVSSEGIY